MKKFKIFLIAFSLLTCSSLAFATEKINEEKIQEIREIINANNENIFGNFKNELNKNGYLENDFLTVVKDAENLKIKKIKFIDFFAEIITEFLNKQEDNKDSVVTKQIVKKSKNKVKCAKIEICDETAYFFPKTTLKDYIVLKYGDKNLYLNFEKDSNLTEIINFKNELKNLNFKEIEKQLKIENFIFEDNLVKIVDEKSLKIKKISLKEFKNLVLIEFSKFYYENEHNSILSPNNKNLFSYKANLVNSQDLKHYNFAIQYNKQENNFKIKINENKKLEDNFLKKNNYEKKIVEKVDFKAFEEYLENKNLIFKKDNEEENLWEYSRDSFKQKSLKKFKEEILEEIKRNLKILLTRSSFYEDFKKTITLVKKNNDSIEFHNLKLTYNAKENKINIEPFKKETFNEEENENVKLYKSFKLKEEQKLLFIKKLKEFLDQNYLIKDDKIIMMKTDSTKLKKISVKDFLNWENLKKKYDKKNLLLVNTKNNEICEIKFYMDDKPNFDKIKNFKIFNKTFKTLYGVSSLEENNISNDFKNYFKNLINNNFNENVEIKNLIRIKNEDTLEKETIKIDDLFTEFKQKFKEKIENKTLNVFDKGQFQIKMGFYLKNQENILLEWKIVPITIECFFDKNCGNEFFIKLFFEEEEKNKDLTFKFQKKEIKNLLDAKLKNLNFLQNCNFKDLKFIKINTNTFEEEKRTLSLNKFENEFAEQILKGMLMNYKEYKCCNNPQKKSKILEQKININDFIVKNKKTNKITPLNFKIIYNEYLGDEKCCIKELNFNRYLLKNLVKKFIKDMTKKPNEKEKQIKKSKSTENLFRKNYKLKNDNFSFNKKFFDDCLEKAGILNENKKIGVLNDLGNKKINYFSLEEFKEIAKKVVAYFGYSKPIIENVVKKDSNGNFYCVNLELICNENENNKIIKIDNFKKNQSSSSYLNEFLKKPSDNYLEENELFYDDSLYSEILDKLEDAGFILNNSIEIYDDINEYKIKKYDKEGFINLIRKKIREKLKEKPFFEKAEFENNYKEKNNITIKNIINKVTKECKNLKLEFYKYPQISQLNLNDVKYVKFLEFSSNKEATNKLKENFNYLTIEEVLEDKKIKTDEKFENIEDLKKAKKLINFFNEKKAKNEPLEKAIKLNMPTKEKLLEFITKTDKIYIKKYEQKNENSFEKDLESLKIPKTEKNLLLENINRKIKQKNKRMPNIPNIKKFLKKFIKEFENQIKLFLIDNLKDLKESKIKNTTKELNFEMENEDESYIFNETITTTKLKLEKFLDPKLLKNYLTNLEFNLLKNAYILHIKIKLNSKNFINIFKLIIPIEKKDEFEKIKENFKEKEDKIKNEEYKIKKIKEIIGNTKENNEIFKKSELEQYIKMTNSGKKFAVENEDLKIKTYNFSNFLKNKLIKKLEKSLEEKGEFEDEYEIIIKNIINNKNTEKCDLIFKIFKKSENDEIYYDFKNPKTNNFEIKKNNLKQLNKNTYLKLINQSLNLVNPAMNTIYFDGENFENVNSEISEEEKYCFSKFLGEYNINYYNSSDEFKKNLTEGYLEQINNIFKEQYLKNDFSFEFNQDTEKCKEYALNNYNFQNYPNKVKFIKQKIKRSDFLNEIIKFNQGALNEVFLIKVEFFIKDHIKIELAPKLIVPTIFLKKEFDKLIEDTEEDLKKNFKKFKDFKDVKEKIGTISKEKILIQAKNEIAKKFEELNLQPKGFYKQKEQIKKEFEKNKEKIESSKKTNNEKKEENLNQIERNKKNIEYLGTKINENTQKIKSLKDSIENDNKNKKNFKNTIKKIEEEVEVLTKQVNKDEGTKEKLEKQIKEIKNDIENLENKKNKIDFLEITNNNKKKNLENLNCEPKKLKITFKSLYYNKDVDLTADVYYYNDLIKIENFSYEISDSEKYGPEEKKEREEIKRKIKTYNLNFFTQKDENKLENLKIAENRKDLELIKNKIVTELKEEDLIKLKKITLTGKTPYVIPLKLEIEYNSENENEKFKWFKLEVYYSVYSQEFKVKNIKLIEKEEYVKEKFKKEEEIKRKEEKERKRKEEEEAAEIKRKEEKEAEFEQNKIDYWSKFEKS